MTFNIYSYTVLDLETFESMTYAESLTHKRRVVVLNSFEDHYMLILTDGKPDSVAYVPLKVKGRQLRCYWG